MSSASDVVPGVPGGVVAEEGLAVGGLTFREIADFEVEQVVALWQECGLTRPWNDPYVDLADARAGDTSTVLVAHAEARAEGTHDDGTHRAAVVATVMAGHDGHRGWLYYVAVAPGRQGAGLGRAAVVAGEAWLAAHGARKVQLMVRSTNAKVVGFYERLGYADQETTVLGRWF